MTTKKSVNKTGDNIHSHQSNNDEQRPSNVVMQKNDGNNCERYLMQNDHHHD
jgi:hypothetical protein